MQVRVVQPWARALPPVVPNGAAYVTLENRGPAGLRLTRASTPAAARVEFHNHIEEGGLMKMRRVESVEVPAGGALTLEPGGLHLMLFDLKREMRAGDSFPLTLQFDGHEPVTVEVAISATAPTGGGDGPAHKPAHNPSHGPGHAHGTKGHGTAQGRD